MTISGSTSLRRSRRVMLATVLAMLVLVAAPARGAGLGEVSLVAYFNNVGIAQDPLSGANFDGGGFAYSAQALLLAGARGGQQVTADGMTFTWPNRSSAAADNMTLDGQVIPILATGATKIGFLGSATHGPVTTQVLLHYRYVDANDELHEVTRSQPLTFSDWTLNAGSRPAEAGNVTALSTRYRVNGSYNPELVATHVFATSIPVDPTMTLDSVEFPVESKIHLFGMTVK